MIWRFNAKDPFHTIFYFAFILISSALFSKTWIEVSGSGVSDVSHNLRDQGYTIQGFRESNISIGALTIFADFVGAFGSGSGILLVVTIFYSYYEEFVKKEN